MSSFIFIGPPGVGKGTQRSKFEEKYGCGSIVPGDLLREEVSKGTELGLRLSDILSQGLLAPHDIVMNVVENKLRFFKDNGVKNIIFDGFPREKLQADALERLLKEYPLYSVKCVLLFKVPDRTVFERIHHRLATGSSPRADDKSDEVIQTRLKVFYSNIKNVVEEFNKAGIVHDIDASGDVSSVFKLADDILAQFME